MTTRTARLAAPQVLTEQLAGGAIRLSNPRPLDAYPNQYGAYLRYWARQTPDRVFLAEREAGGAWRKLTYGEAGAAVDRISQWLIDRGASGARPVAALGDNAINLALLKFAAIQIGIPFLPISPAYSLMSENFAKLRHVASECRPAVLHVPAVAPFAKALSALADLDLGDVTVIADAQDPGFPAAVPFADLLATPATAEVDRRFMAVGGDTVAKILLTSGSTGMPKGVINTHRMLCSNGVALDQCWPFLTDQPPVIVDWLPWSHTFGTNFNQPQIMRNGGTMYIDAGKPVPGRFQQTLANLRDVQQTLLYNVPRGFDMLVPAMEADDAFARHVLAKVDIIFYAGAALPAHLWKRLDALAVKHRGLRIPVLSALGSTETSPVATTCHWIGEEPGGIGLPVPGTTVKLVPNGGKLEIRVKGPNITPGYYNRPDLTARAFDDDGYFLLGDAVRFVDPQHPEKGLVFDGRVSENFKLTSGTWVHVGELRLAVISAATPIIQDAAVAGHDRAEVGLLVFPNLAACREIAGLADGPVEAVVTHPAVKARLAESLRAFNAGSGGSSRQISRALMMTEPPSVDGNEITDKGYLNQRAIIERRAALVARLYSDTPGPDVVVVPA